MGAATIDLLEQYLKFYFSFKGRLNRKLFFLCILEIFGLVAFFCLPVLAGVYFNVNGMLLIVPGVIMFVVCSILNTIIIYIPMVKRLHDLNLSGWWLLFVLLLSFPATLVGGEIRFLSSLDLEMMLAVIGVIVNSFFLIILFFMKGTKGDNKYGLDPIEVKNIKIPRLPIDAVFILVLSAFLSIFFYLN